MAFQKSRHVGFRCGTCSPEKSFPNFLNLSSIMFPRELLTNPRARTEFYDSINRQQSFPFRDSFVNYIAKNPASPTVNQKLNKSCKYFFDKNPVLVVSKLTFKYYSSGWRICWKGIEIKYENALRKFWITRKIEIINKTEETDKEPPITTIIPKIFKLDIRGFSLTNQNIAFNNLMLFVSKCEWILLDKVTVKNKDGSVRSLEELVENLPNVKTFQYEVPYDTSHIITSKTVQNLLKVPHFSNLKKFSCYEIPEIFDLKRFYDHIKQDDNTDFNLHFRSQISEELKNRINVIKEEIYNAEYREKSIEIMFR